MAERIPNGQRDKGDRKTTVAVKTGPLAPKQPKPNPAPLPTEAPPNQDVPRPLPIEVPTETASQFGIPGTTTRLSSI